MAAFAAVSIAFNGIVQGKDSAGLARTTHRDRGLIVAIIAGVFGFGGISAAATDIARLLFVVFLVLFLIALFVGRRGTAPPL